ncbi:hypothetical protein BC834DRAFT_974102 [Gloeopeniophorella convolvens]|nr:hypothetical protein BC834DRAFT_974102 [Gloeopeniophorella convolvens]
MLSNPTAQKRKQRQASRPHATRPKLTQTALEDVRARRQEANNAYAESLHALALDIKSKINDIAAKYKKSYDTVESNLNLGTGRFGKGKHEKASAWHAYQWKLGQNSKENKDASEEVEFAQRPTLRAVEYHALTQEEKNEMIKEYEEYRETRRVGEWMTAQSKTNDVVSTLSRVELELANLEARTKAAALLFVVRGDVDHPMKPITFATKGLLQFIDMALGIDTGDFLSRLEGFATHGIKGAANAHAKMNLTLLRQTVNTLITTGLRNVTGDADIDMKWGAGYWHKIVKTHRVIIKCWPPNITFACLTKSCGSIGDLRVLLTEWEEGKTYWAKLTDREFSEEERERNNKIKAGLLPPDKRRKSRNDKGKSREKSRKSSSKVPRPHPISAAIIDDSEDEDENENEGEIENGDEAEDGENDAAKDDDSSSSSSDNNNNINININGGGSGSGDHSLSGSPSKKRRIEKENIPPNESSLVVAPAINDLPHQLQSGGALMQTFGSHSIANGAHPPSLISPYSTTSLWDPSNSLLGPPSGSLLDELYDTNWLASNAPATPTSSLHIPGGMQF